MVEECQAENCGKASDINSELCGMCHYERKESKDNFNRLTNRVNK